MGHIVAQKDYQIYGCFKLFLRTYALQNLNFNSNRTNRNMNHDNYCWGFMWLRKTMNIEHFHVFCKKCLYAWLHNHNSIDVAITSSSAINMEQQMNKSTFYIGYLSQLK